MACKRCEEDKPLDKRGWCIDCERAYDTWVRRYASDIVKPALTGMVIVLAVALGVPLLGASTLVALGGVFAGAGTIFGLTRLSARRRRRQFLTSSLPRAYLPEKS